LRNVVGERVVGVGRGQQRLDRKKDRADLQRGRPFVLENVEADAAELVCGVSWCTRGVLQLVAMLGLELEGFQVEVAATMWSQQLLSLYSPMFGW
jgi:hypothetical protein